VLRRAGDLTSTLRKHVASWVSSSSTSCCASCTTNAITDDSITDDTTFGALRGGYNSEDEDEDDPTKMLARLMRQSASKGTSDNHGSGSDVDPWRLIPARRSSYSIFAEFDEGFSNAEEATLCGDFDNDPSHLLEELRGSVVVRNNETANEGSDNDPRRMLAELEREIRPLGSEPLQDDSDDDDSYEALRLRLAHLNSDARPVEVLKSSVSRSHDRPLDGNIIPYVVALQLEASGHKWEDAKAWATYLFSTGLDGHEAQQEKRLVVQRATEGLDRIIEEVMADEQRYHAVEHSTRMLRRLVVANLAADADEEDVVRFFYQWRLEV
jgi:hypothetical protein